jgi:hypothetical protein
MHINTTTEHLVVPQLWPARSTRCLIAKGLWVPGPGARLSALYRVIINIGSSNDSDAAGITASHRTGHPVA